MKNKKLIPEIRFPEFSGEWVEKRLGEIGKIEMCKRVFKNQTNPKNGIPFYKISTFGKTPDAFIDRKLFEEYKEKYPYPKKGDILISTSGSIGKTVVFNGEDSYYQDSNIVWINNPETKILNKVLKFIYETIHWEKYVENTTISRLYNDNLKKIKIYIPPTLSEQKKISDFLSSVDEKIEIVSKKIEELKKYKKGMIQKLLDVKCNNGKCEPELRFKGFSGNWIEKRLGEIGEFKKGTAITSNEIINGNIPVIAGGKKPAYYHNKSNRNGNIITISSSGANAGFINYFDIPIFASDCFTILGLTNLANTKFIYYNLILLQNKIFSLQSGGAQPHIYPKDLKKLKLHLPPTLAEQEKIASFLSSIDEKIELNENKLEQLKAYKQGLLQKMVV